MVEDNRETFVSFLQNAHPIIQLIFRILDAQLGLPKDTLASLQRPGQPSGTIVRLLSVTHPGLPPDAADEDVNWQYVKPEPDCAIINQGDAMVEWNREYSPLQPAQCSLYLGKAGRI
jgi:hypothetical protein